jgi:hypothetical protein
MTISSLPFDPDDPVVSFDDPRSRLVSEFCNIENISISSFHSLERRGLAPEVLRPPGSKIKRITHASHAAWRQRMREHAQSEEAELERRRRSALARIGGQKSAASPNHVTKQSRGPC